MLEQLISRAVIQYLDGNMDEFERLKAMALKANNEMACDNCNGVQIPCRIGHKGNMQRGYICTKCGQVVINGKIYRQGKDLRGAVVC
jgi:hypothetical protein